jgi:Fur family transcriptional regulator, ferric uptake regulator
MLGGREELYDCAMDLPPLPSTSSGAADADSMIMAPLCSVFRRFLRSQNLKYTPERAEILNAIIERNGVFEAEELLLEMRHRGYQVSKATIYRTIKLLLDGGIITQALFDSKQAHYQLIYGKAPQDFMVCMKTGKRIQFSNRDLIALRDRICRELGWDPVGHRFQIYAISPEGRAMQELGEDTGSEADESGEDEAEAG